MSKVISWDECFMRICHVIAQRSKDPNTQNGSVVVNGKNIVIGLGYNGFPRGINDNILPWEREGGFCDTKYAYVVHAEENAIYNANAQTEGCILYCTLFPCNECVKTIIQSGIKEIVYEGDTYHDKEIWVAARKLLDIANIKYRQYVLPDESAEFEKPSPKIEKLKILKLHPLAIVPSFAREGDAGLDLFSIEGMRIEPGERASIPTGIAMEIPKGFVGMIWDRTGISLKKGLKVIGGVFDSSYRGEAKVLMANISSDAVEIMQGDKVAQMVIQPFSRPEIELTAELSKTERADQMFGSSDKIDQTIGLAQEIEELKESPLYKKIGNFEAQNKDEIKEGEEEDENSTRW